MVNLPPPLYLLCRVFRWNHTIIRVVSRLYTVLTTPPTHMCLRYMHAVAEMYSEASRSSREDTKSFVLIRKSFIKCNFWRAHPPELSPPSLLLLPHPVGLLLHPVGIQEIVVVGIKVDEGQYAFWHLAEVSSVSFPGLNSLEIELWGLELVIWRCQHILNGEHPRVPGVSVFLLVLWHIYPCVYTG